MFDPTQGPARELIRAEELAKLLPKRTVVFDDRRRRPRYFDGRFLAARDLTREQSYFLTRQADLGRALGMGVVHGLMVRRGRDSSSLEIMPGHGITSSGESVVVPRPLPVDLTDVPRFQRLDAAFGFLRIPRLPPRNLTGLFIVALRPVEFSANPIASYPTSVTERRRVEDGDIVEGVAVTLIPYPDRGARDELDARRSRVAREIFVEGSRKGIHFNALPLAMVALNRSLVVWIDTFMVRREVGADHSDVLGFGISSRALREAFLQQYRHHLQDVMVERGHNALRFSASEYFQALPPVGPMPSGTIDPREFTQVYFPPEMDVDLALMPQDEMPALIDESLPLPAIELALGGEDLESTSVTVLIPVPRHAFRQLGIRLREPSAPRPIIPTRLLRPAAPGLIARRRPLEALRALTLPRLRPIIPRPVDPVAAAWSEALTSTPILWYVRRRNLECKADVLGEAVEVVVEVEDEIAEEENLRNRLEGLGLGSRFLRLRREAAAGAVPGVVTLLRRPGMSSPTIVRAALTELEERETPDRTSVEVVSERFSDPELGEGIRRLEATNPEFATDERVVRDIERSGVVPELDRVARRLEPAALASFAERLREIAGGTGRGRPERVAGLVRETLEGLDQ